MYPVKSLSEEKAQNQNPGNGKGVPGIIPDYIKNHRYGWLFGPIWRSVHVKNEMFMCLVLGKPGRGKSWLSIALADFLDTDARGNPKFQQENICFSPKQFTNIFSSNFHPGKAIVLDDAGLSLYNRESMTREVINLTKMAQSMRFKNPIVFFTLPHDAMIDKNILRLIDARIIVKGYQNKVTKFSFQMTKTYPTTDKIYYPFPTVNVIQKTRNGIGLNRTFKIRNCFFERAPLEILSEYEDRKSDYMTALYRKFGRFLVKSEPASFSEAYIKVKNNLARYQRKGPQSPVDPYRILIDGDIEITSQAHARKIAELINAEFNLSSQSKRRGV